MLICGADLLGAGAWNRNTQRITASLTGQRLPSHQRETPGSAPTVVTSPSVRGRYYRAFRPCPPPERVSGSVSRVRSVLYSIKFHSYLFIFFHTKRKGRRLNTSHMS